jgi:hypothetical protein
VRGLGFAGAGWIGEVEDYRVFLTRSENCDMQCSGTDYWLAFLGSYAPNPANPVKPFVSASGSPETVVTVQIPGLNFSKSGAIPAAGVISFELPSHADHGKSNEQIQNKGVHVVATAAVTLHALSKASHTSDGFMALHTDALGTEYVV